VGAVDNDGMHALQLTKGKARKEIKRLLREFGATDSQGNKVIQKETEEEREARERARAVRESLFAAAQSGDFATLEAILDLIQQVDVRNQAGSTPFMVAAINEHFELANFLLDWGADVNAVDDRGQSAFTRAKMLGKSEVIEWLKSKGSKEQEIEPPRKKKKKIPQKHDMMTLVEANNAREVERLILTEPYPDLNQLDFGKRKTPLIAAAELGHTDIVRLLLLHGAEPNVVDAKNGFSPLMLASRQGHSAIVRHLLLAGADANHAGHAGLTALILAAQRDNTDILNLLLAAGAKPTEADTKGRTAIDIVKKRQKIRRILEESKRFEADPEAWVESVLRKIQEQPTEDTGTIDTSSSTPRDPATTLLQAHDALLFAVRSEGFTEDKMEALLPLWSRFEEYLETRYGHREEGEDYPEPTDEEVDALMDYLQKKLDGK
jgi:ankyrin repeat protein